jgi:hypothetical protein
MVEIHKLQEIMHLRNCEYKIILLLCLHNTRVTNYISLAIRKRHYLAINYYSVNDDIVHDKFRTPDLS